MRIKMWLVVGAIIFYGAQSVWAVTVVFNTSDSQFEPGLDNQGWWSDTRSNSGTHDNYAAGIDPDGNYYRNFFTFDLSSLGVTVMSARLELTRFEYSSSAGSETLGLFDVSTDAAVLNNNVGTSASIYTDLGTGASYGEFQVLSSGSEEDVLFFDLNANAIEHINNAAGGWFSIGGSLLSFGSPVPDGTEALFGRSSGEGTQRLVVEVIPEPASVLFLGVGALSLRKRKRM